MVDNKPSTVEIKTPTRFVQVASINSLCQEWNSNDRIIIFRTEVSNDVNWIDISKNGTGLKTELTNLLDSWKSRDGHSVPQLNPGEDTDPKKYIVPNGFVESELWTIFEQVYECVNEKDEIYFDVTHAFRTIPLFTTVLFNYCRLMKETKICSIHYGAFEDIKRFNKIDQETLSKMTPEEKSALKVPLVDVSSIVKLQTINEAVSNFLQFGEMGSIIQILNDEGHKLTEKEGIGNIVQSIQKALGDLNYYTQTVNLFELRDGKFFHTIKENIKKLDEEPLIIMLPHPERMLLKKIYQELKAHGFVDYSSYTNIEAAIMWLSSKNLIQQAVTLASEYIQHTFLGLYYDCEYTTTSDPKTDKPIISYILKEPKRLNGVRVSFEYNDWRRKTCDFDNRQVLRFLQIKGVFEITEPYDKLRLLRNALNHASDLEPNFNNLEDAKNYFVEEIWNPCLDALAYFEESQPFDGHSRESIWDKFR